METVFRGGTICLWCSKALRRDAAQDLFPRAARLYRDSSEARRRLHSGRIAHEEQGTPLTGYYAELLNHPRRQLSPATRTAPSPPPNESLPKTEREQVLEKARVVFGSRLAGPGERRDEIQRASTNVAGIVVPPRPTEPDNCCMSGCVNCVWDMYREELEEWASRSAEARERLHAQRAKGEGSGMMVTEAGMPHHVATSMDDDGGGSETNWSTGLAMSGQSGDIFQGIPVGIREFMKTEKMLKERHTKEQAAAG